MSIAPDELAGGYPLFALVGDQYIIPQPAPSGIQYKRCNCKKAKCLKLYCVCFAAGVYCQGCNCLECSNIPERSEVVLQERGRVLQREPLAFTSKLVGPVHAKGCKCRKSRCVKKYCDCFDARVRCSGSCKCKDCMNQPDAGAQGGPQAPGHMLLPLAAPDPADPLSAALSQTALLQQVHPGARPWAQELSAAGSAAAGAAAAAAGSERSSSRSASPAPPTNHMAMLQQAVAAAAQPGVPAMLLPLGPGGAHMRLPDAAAAAEGAAAWAESCQAQWEASAAAAAAMPGQLLPLQVLAAARQGAPTLNDSQQQQLLWQGQCQGWDQASSGQQAGERLPPAGSAAGGTSAGTSGRARGRANSSGGQAAPPAADRRSDSAAPPCNDWSAGAADGAADAAAAAAHMQQQQQQQQQQQRCAGRLSRSGSAVAGNDENVPLLPLPPNDDAGAAAGAASGGVAASGGGVLTQGRLLQPLQQQQAVAEGPPGHHAWGEPGGGRGLHQAWLGIAVKREQAAPAPALENQPAEQQMEQAAAHLAAGSVGQPPEAVPQQQLEVQMQQEVLPMECPEGEAAAATTAEERQHEEQLCQLHNDPMCTDEPAGQPGATAAAAAAAAAALPVDADAAAAHPDPQQQAARHVAGSGGNEASAAAMLRHRQLQQVMSAAPDTPTSSCAAAAAAGGPAGSQDQQMTDDAAAAAAAAGCGASLQLHQAAAWLGMEPVGLLQEPAVAGQLAVGLGLGEEIRMAAVNAAQLLSDIIKLGYQTAQQQAEGQQLQPALLQHQHGLQQHGLLPDLCGSLGAAAGGRQVALLTEQPLAAMVQATATEADAAVHPPPGLLHAPNRSSAGAAAAAAAAATAAAHLNKSLSAVAAAAAAAAAASSGSPSPMLAAAGLRAVSGIRGPSPLGAGSRGHREAAGLQALLLPLGQQQAAAASGTHSGGGVSGGGGGGGLSGGSSARRVQLLPGSFRLGGAGSHASPAAASPAVTISRGGITPAAQPGHSLLQASCNLADSPAGSVSLAPSTASAHAAEQQAAAGPEHTPMISTALKRRRPDQQSTAEGQAPATVQQQQQHEQQQLQLHLLLRTPAAADATACQGPAGAGAAAAGTAVPAAAGMANGAGSLTPISSLNPLCGPPASAPTPGLWQQLRQPQPPAAMQRQASGDGASSDGDGLLGPGGGWGGWGGVGGGAGCPGGLADMTPSSLLIASFLGGRTPTDLFLTSPLPAIGSALRGGCASGAPAAGAAGAGPGAAAGGSAAAGAGSRAAQVAGPRGAGDVTPLLLHMAGGGLGGSSTGLGRQRGSGRLQHGSSSCGGVGASGVAGSGCGSGGKPRSGVGVGALCTGLPGANKAGAAVAAGEVTAGAVAGPAPAAASELHGSCPSDAPASGAKPDTDKAAARAAAAATTADTSAASDLAAAQAAVVAASAQVCDAGVSSLLAAADFISSPQFDDEAPAKRRKHEHPAAAAAAAAHFDSPRNRQQPAGCGKRGGGRPAAEPWDTRPGPEPLPASAARLQGEAAAAPAAGAAAHGDQQQQQQQRVQPAPRRVLLPGPMEPLRALGMPAAAAAAGEGGQCGRLSWPGPGLPGITAAQHLVQQQAAQLATIKERGATPEGLQQQAAAAAAHQQQQQQQAGRVAGQQPAPAAAGDEVVSSQQQQRVPHVIGGPPPRVLHQPRLQAVFEDEVAVMTGAEPQLHGWLSGAGAAAPGPADQAAPGADNCGDEQMLQSPPVAARHGAFAAAHAAADRSPSIESFAAADAMLALCDMKHFRQTSRA